MFRATVRATEETDVEAVVSSLQARCDHAGLSSHDTAVIAGQALQTLDSLVQRGRELGSLGSQMHVRREISGEGYSVKIIFRTGDRRNLFQRVMDVLRGR